MTTILAIDTATTACSVALSHKGEVRQEFIDTPREHTRLVLPMVDKLLALADIPLARVDALAFTCGPGSFTGLRIGFGVIQGLAFGGNIPVIPVSTLKVMAHRAMREMSLQEGLVVPALDARMNEIYWGIYQVVGGSVEAHRADTVSTPEEALAAMTGPVNAGVGDGWSLLKPHSMPPSRVNTALTPDARSIIDIAHPLFVDGAAKPVERIELSYIRNEVSWKKRQKIRQP
ncbi:MAG: hypothetical protein VR73_00920 [Gammaproteobacteria bacterium BRH_c0]|nr:MAG: hypothetical protein VR73_00920 [Gammaproteobacteria bacterium BRH_c0]